jgi:hypothetical protein
MTRKQQISGAVSPLRAGRSASRDQSPGGSRTACVTWILLLLLAVPCAVSGQDFIYKTNNNTITILGYTGSVGMVTIPSTIDGLPVTTLQSLTGADLTNI